MPTSTFTIAVGKWQEAKSLPHNHEEGKSEEPCAKSDRWVISLTLACNGKLFVLYWNLWRLFITAETLNIQEVGLRTKAVKT